MGGALKKFTKAVTNPVSLVKTLTNPLGAIGAIASPMVSPAGMALDALTPSKKAAAQDAPVQMPSATNVQNGPTGDGTSSTPPSVTNPQVDEAFKRALDEAKKRRGRGTTSAQGALELLFGNAYGNAVAL